MRKRLWPSCRCCCSGKLQLVLNKAVCSIWRDFRCILTGTVWYKTPLVLWGPMSLHFLQQLLPICPKLMWMDLAPIRVKYLVSKIPNRSKGQHRTTVHSLNGKLVWTTRSRENLGFITENQVLNKWAPIYNAASSSAVRGCTCASGCAGLEDETLLLTINVYRVKRLVSGCRTRRFCFTAPLLRGSSKFLITFKQNVIPVKPSTTKTIPEML